MQILEIVLFGRNGGKRVLHLRPGKVNIITGQSHTGKSALIHIVATVSVVVDATCQPVEFWTLSGGLDYFCKPEARKCLSRVRILFRNDRLPQPLSWVGA